MKVFAIFALLAVAVAVAANDPPSAPVTIAPVADYVGKIQETEGGPIEEVLGVVDEPPICRLGNTLGNPICFGRCIALGHAGGHCEGKVCVCFG